VVTTREKDESYQEGEDVPPFDEVAFYGAGWPIIAENLAAYLAGHEPEDVEAWWTAFVPPYQELAADIG
jgi:hypothetical protein